MRDLLHEMVETYKLKPKLNQTRVQNIWQKMMGTTINRYTKSLRIHKDRLIITLESSPLKQELIYGKEKIRKTMNEQLGEEAIKEVVIW